MIDPLNSNTERPRWIYEISDLCRSYNHGKIKALRGVNLSVADNDFLVIRGPSGSGKSTLLSLIATLEQPDGGSIKYQNTPFDHHFDRIKYRSRELGLVFQEFHLLPTFTALENIQMPMLEMPWSRAERVTRGLELLKSVGLEKRAGHLPSELSGGEKQRVAIARALANQPRVILADEPTGNLDSENAIHVMELLSELHQREGIVIVMVTHDAKIASYASREIHMMDGQIISNEKNQLNKA